MNNILPGEWKTIWQKPKPVQSKITIEFVGLNKTLMALKAFQGKIRHIRREYEEEQDLLNGL